MNSFSKFMGIFRMILSFLWMGAIGVGAVYGLRGINWTGERIDHILALSGKNIAAINLLLVEITDIVEKVDLSLGTIEHTIIDTSLTIGESRPLLDETAQVITDDVPNALDDIQASMPSVIAAAASIDDTLRVLSKFKFEIPNIFGDNWVISLGVDYAPEVPLEIALQNLSTNLEGMPDSMRGMAGDITTTDANFVLMSDDLLMVASDLDKIREQMADINPQMETIILNLEEVETSLNETQNRIPDRLVIARKVFIGLMALLILSQIPSAYIGYLVAKNRFLSLESAVK